MTSKMEKPVYGGETPGRAGGEKGTTGFGGNGHAAGFARPIDIIRQNDGDIQPANKVIGINQVYHAGRNTAGQRQMFGIHSQVLQSVVYLLSIGVSVLPLPYASKKPAPESVEGADGMKWEDAMKYRLPHDDAALPLLADLFTPTNGLPANIAAVCGAVSDNLFVLDYDERAAYERAIAALERLDVPIFASISGSGDGGHIWFRCADGEVKNGYMRQNRQHIGEIIARRKYIVVPPSRHPDGGFYIWDARKTAYRPPVLSFDDLRAIARELPGQPKLTLNGIRRNSGGGGGVSTNEPGGNEPGSGGGGLFAETINFLQYGPPNGERNERLKWAARDYAYTGRTLDDAHRDLGARARAAGLPENEIQTAIRNGHNEGIDARKQRTSSTGTGAVGQTGIPDGVPGMTYRAAQTWLNTQKFKGSGGRSERATFAALMTRFAAETFGGGGYERGAFRASQRELVELAMLNVKDKRSAVRRALARLIKRAVIEIAGQTPQGANIYRFGSAVVGSAENAANVENVACENVGFVAQVPQYTTGFLPSGDTGASTRQLSVTPDILQSDVENGEDTNSSDNDRHATRSGASLHPATTKDIYQNIPHKQLTLLWGGVCTATDERIFRALNGQTTQQNAVQIAALTGLHRSTVAARLADDAPLVVHGLALVVQPGKRRYYAACAIDRQTVQRIIADVERVRDDVVKIQHEEERFSYLENVERYARKAGMQMLHKFLQHRRKHPALWAVGQLRVIASPFRVQVWQIVVEVLHQRDGQQINAPQNTTQDAGKNTTSSDMRSTTVNEHGQRLDVSPFVDDQHDAMPDDPFGVSLFDDMPLFVDDQRDAIPDDVFGPPPFDDVSPFGDGVPDATALIAFQHAMARELVAVQ